MYFQALNTSSGNKSKYKNIFEKVFDKIIISPSKYNVKMRERRLEQMTKKEKCFSRMA